MKEEVYFKWKLMIGEIKNWEITWMEIVSTLENYYSLSL